jgi:uncharacterized protein YjiS (DUF1127 family)
LRCSRREQAIADGLRSPPLKLWDCVMNAYVSPEELALLPADQINFAQHHSDAKAGKSGVVATIFARITAFVERQRVLSELNGLSDRELADIGLNRAELPQVFARPLNYRQG